MIEPVSLALAKTQLRVGGVSEDALIEQHIAAAREWVEKKTGHILVRREIVESFASLASTVNIRAWPNVVVTKVEAAGSILDATAYVVSPAVRPAQVGLVTSAGWAGLATSRVAASSQVTVTMTAGYPDGEVPSRFITAMLILITDLYENREGSEMSAAATTAAMSWIKGDRRRVL